jgi:hypothetical protein
MASEIFQRLQKQVKPENMQFVSKNLAIGRQVRHIMASHPTINSQKALAEALGKEPSEISKWLNGLHNIGLENITRMEVALGQDIILTDEQARERYSKPAGGDYQVFKISRYAGKVDHPASSVAERQLSFTHPDGRKPGTTH